MIFRDISYDNFWGFHIIKCIWMDYTEYIHRIKSQNMIIMLAQVTQNTPNRQLKYIIFN